MAATRSASGYISAVPSIPNPTAPWGTSGVRIGDSPGTRINHSPRRLGNATTPFGEIKSKEATALTAPPLVIASTLASITPTRTPMNEPGPTSAIQSVTSPTLVSASASSRSSMRKHAPEAARGASSIALQTRPSAPIKATEAIGLEVEKVTITVSARYSATAPAGRSNRAGRLQT